MSLLSRTGTGRSPPPLIRNMLRGQDPDDVDHNGAGLAAPAETWLRRLYTAPDTGALVAMDTRRRRFDGQLRRFLITPTRHTYTSRPPRPVGHSSPVERASPADRDMERAPPSALEQRLRDRRRTGPPGDMMWLRRPMLRGSMTAQSEIPVVWSEATLAHRPDREVWIGLPLDGSEFPERVTMIEQALRAQGHEFMPATAHSDEALTTVHSSRLVRHLSTVYGDWVDGGFPDHGQDRVVPYFFPTEAMLGPITPAEATSVHARVGQFCYDTMTTVGPGSWEAIRAAADCALSAADLVTSGRASQVYALCRPPGHHVTHDAYGGSCYLNNAALAAQALVDAGHEHVAVIDVDAHHGNGTAAIFYDRADVLYGSVHVDPAAGWFPHVVGHATETGVGAGIGTTLNVPLAPGSGDDPFLDGVRRLAEAARRHASSALVVSLGVDAAADDPESPLQVTLDGYREAGALLLTDLNLPTVVVQEGGYHLPTLGELVAAFLARDGVTA